MKRETIKRRRTEITVETRRQLVFHVDQQGQTTGQQGQTAAAEQAEQSRGELQWCAACAQTVMMLTPEDAATVAGVSARTIYRWVETDRAHFDEAPNGTLRVCLNSLQAELP